MSAATIYLCLLVLTAIAALALWRVNPTTGSKLAGFLDRKSVVWIQLSLFLLGLALPAFVHGPPKAAVVALLYLGTAPFLVRWVGLLFAWRRVVRQGEIEIPR